MCNVLAHAAGHGQWLRIAPGPGGEGLLQEAGPRLVAASDEAAVLWGVAEPVLTLLPALPCGSFPGDDTPPLPVC